MHAIVDQSCSLPAIIMKSTEERYYREREGGREGKRERGEERIKHRMMTKRQTMQ